MDDAHTGTEATGTVTPVAPPPTPAPPQHQSPIEQTKDMAKKVLAMITGRPKS